MKKISKILLVNIALALLLFTNSAFAVGGVFINSVKTTTSVAEVSGRVDQALKDSLLARNASMKVMYGKTPETMQLAVEISPTSNGTNVPISASNTFSFSINNLDRATDYTIEFVDSLTNEKYLVPAFLLTTNGVVLDDFSVGITETSAYVTGRIVGLSRPGSVKIKWQEEGSTTPSISPERNGSINGNFDYQITGLGTGKKYKISIVDPKNSAIILAEGEFTTKSPTTPGGVVIGPVAGVPSGAGEGNCTESQSEYCLLAPLPLLGDKVDATLKFGDYVNTAIKIIIGLCAVLAVLMIVLGGIQWMSSTDSVGAKSAGKERIRNALLGLLIVLAAFAILNTINPNLVNLKIGIDQVSVEVDEPPDEVVVGGKTVYSSKGRILTVGGKVFAKGEPWPPAGMGLVSVRSQLSGVSIPSPECTVIGQKNCTSTYFTPAIASTFVGHIQLLKAACNCNVTITGASEYWLHRTHTPEDALADLRASENSLNIYISGSSSFPNNGQTYSKPLGQFLAEKSGQTSNTTAPHWHVNFR